MRTNIYYWKCDSPLPAGEKRGYNDKRHLSDISNLVAEIATGYFGEEPVSVRNNRSEGNHYTYLVEYPNRPVLFRGDDEKIDDDYMEAEAAAVELVRKQGVPAPEIYLTDTTKSRYPFRFQLIELVPGQALNALYDDGSLDRSSIGHQLGRYAGFFHRIRPDGFGFFNTEILRKEGRVAGLDSTNRGYFRKRLDDHLKYLRDTEFLTAETISRIEKLFQKNEHLLDIKQGSLAHKDLAFWNLIGTTDRINGIVDWDDVVISDPIDDLSIIKCFYDEDVFDALLEGYSEVSGLPSDFQPKLYLYLVRNMLWKAVIRIFMGYFKMKGNFFILGRKDGVNLKEVTYQRLFSGIEKLEAVSGG